MVYKILGSIVIACALALGVGVIYQEGLIPTSIKESAKTSTELTCIDKTPSEQLRSLIEKDFIHLYSNKELPSEWNQIGQVKIIRNSNLAKALLGKFNPSFKTLENGPFYLEVELIDLEEESNPGIILQASLFNKKTENKVFEIGRTYTMNDLNKISDEVENNSVPQSDSKTTTPKDTGI